MLTIFLRTLLLYFLLLFMMRLTGKRQIGEIQLSELVTTFLLSEIVSLPLTNPGIPLLYAVVPIIAIVTMEIIFSYLAMKKPKIKRILDSSPAVLIERGQIQKTTMEKIRLTLDDLLREMRLHGIGSIGEIEYAILESSGKISFFKKGDPSLSHTLILDGTPQKKSLSLTKTRESTLLSLLQHQNINLQDVFCFSVTDEGKITLIRKDDTR